MGCGEILRLNAVKSARSARAGRGVVLLIAVLFTPAPAVGDDAAAKPNAPRIVDATSLKGKVLCGYQGWFRCPSDPAGGGWRHWSRDPAKLGPGTVSVEMWPDMSEYAADEKFPVPGFTYPDGQAAHLFSSAHPKTVERHFRWMEQYGIDGVFVQRFLVEVGDPSTDRVLGHVRSAAAQTGRVYAICYDLSGASKEKLYDRLVADWKRLVDEQKVTQDERYLHHGGKPVVFVWGFFSDRFSAALAHRIIDLFKGSGRYGATLIGGCEWEWRAERNLQWARAFRRFDIISPWNVGNVTQEGNRKQAATGHWKDDLAEAKRAGMAYLPVIYPGFGWTNLKGKRTAAATVPRLGGEFYWRQFTTAANLGIDMAYVAMFDEVDEGTAIFKVTNTPPTQAKFATYDGLPTDWYLRLTGEGSKVIRGEKKSQATLPIKP
jgi:hypothetical protein